MEDGRDERESEEQEGEMQLLQQESEEQEKDMEKAKRRCERESV